MENQWQTGTCKFGWCRAVTGLPQGFGGKESARSVQETQEMWVQSLGWEDPLEEEKVIFLLGKSIAEEPGGLQSMELQKSQTQLTRTYRVESFDHLQHPRESSASGIKERDLATTGSVSSRSL